MAGCSSPGSPVLDETDSGLDIDALKIVAEGVNRLRSPERSMIVITHYQRLLDYIVPDKVHVLSQGRIVRSGGRERAGVGRARLRLDRRGAGQPSRSRNRRRRKPCRARHPGGGWVERRRGRRVRGSAAMSAIDFWLGRHRDTAADPARRRSALARPPARGCDRPLRRQGWPTRRETGATPRLPSWGSRRWRCARSPPRRSWRRCAHATRRHDRAEKTPAGVSQLSLRGQARSHGARALWERTCPRTPDRRHPRTPATAANSVPAKRRPGHWLVFVDGRFAPALSAIGGLPGGAKIGSLADALKLTPEAVEAAFGSASDGETPQALNAALATDGAWIRLGRGVVVEQAITCSSSSVPRSPTSTCATSSSPRLARRRPSSSSTTRPAPPAAR